MPRDVLDATEGIDEDGGASEGPESAATGTSESPSMEFLRDLAHVSDQSPGAFDLALVGAGEADAAAPSSRRFLVRRRLGAGGFGTVYEAFDHQQHATVALKVLRRRDWRSIAGFKGEFRSLVETVHDNLVQLHELHAEAGEWFFTMELVPGVDALAYLRPAGGPCEATRLRSVFRQLACGLAFLHDAGKLHRDVKPSNVMVTGEGRVVIVDFGLAGDISELQGPGVFGTPAYMAPEQAAGLQVGAAADWYAVGVMLYQALTGRLPVGDAELLATPPGARDSDGLTRLSTAPGAQPWTGPPPSALVVGVPEDLDRLCVELLAHEAGRRPTGREVCRRLAAQPGAASGLEAPGRSGEASFVGREPQLAELRDALAAAEQGRSVTVLLHGRPGLGKSALVRRFMGELRGRDPERLVLFGRCFEQESVPYKGVDGLIDGLCRRLRERPGAAIAAALPGDFPLLARLFPQLHGLAGPRQAADIDDPQHRQRAFAALRELLVRAAPRAPVLVVDDLQWGDLDSTALLAALLHGRAPLLLVTTYRAEEAATNPVLRAFFAALAAIEDQAELRHVEVGPLDDREAAALSRSLLATEPRTGEAPAEAVVQALVAEARGDPLLLSELARREPGDPAAARGHELGSLIAGRISRLPAAARRLLEVVALDGQPVARAVAARAAYGNERASEALGAIGVLRAGRLLRSRRVADGEELLPYHDRIRELVIRGLDVDLGRGHHHQLALALAASGTAEPERLLFHYRSAGQLAEAARQAAQAARRAHAALAFDRAARLYREALALGGSDSDRAAGSGDDRELRVALADALAGAGRPREAGLAYLEAARGADPAAMQVLRRRAAELLLGAGYVDDGLATLREVLRDVDITVSSSLPRSLLGFAALRLRLAARGLGFRERPEGAVGRQELLRVDACYAAAMGLLLTNPILAAESQARHLLHALAAGEPFRVARALALEAVFTAVRRGSGGATESLLETARGLERRVAHPHLTGIVRLCESQVAQVAARWPLAHALAVESESVLRQRCTGVALEIDLACFRRSDLLWNLGEVAELSRLVPTLVDAARERGNRFLEMMVQLSTGSLLGLVEGRPERAREAVATSLERWSRPPGSLIHVREIRAEARIALYEGRGRAALAAIEAGLAAMRRTGLSLARTQTGELRIMRALAALSVGDDAAAARYTRAFAGLGFRWTENPERIVKAGLARRAGDLRAALALLGRAREAAREQGAALFQLAMSRRLGQWIAGDEGRAEVEAADLGMAGQGIADPERMTGMLLGWV